MSRDSMLLVELDVRKSAHLWHAIMYAVLDWLIDDPNLLMERVRVLSYLSEISNAEALTNVKVWCSWEIYFHGLIPLELRQLMVRVMVRART
jgi:hypothetical protein